MIKSTKVLTTLEACMVATMLQEKLSVSNFYDASDGKQKTLHDYYYALTGFKEEKYFSIYVRGGKHGHFIEYSHNTTGRAYLNKILKETLNQI